MPAWPRFVSEEAEAGWPGSATNSRVGAPCHLPACPLRPLSQRPEGWARPSDHPLCTEGGMEDSVEWGPARSLVRGSSTSMSGVPPGRSWDTQAACGLACTVQPPCPLGGRGTCCSLQMPYALHEYFSILCPPFLCPCSPSPTPPGRACRSAPASVFPAAATRGRCCSAAGRLGAACTKPGAGTSRPGFPLSVRPGFDQGRRSSPPLESASR